LRVAHADGALCRHGERRQGTDHCCSLVVILNLGQVVGGVAMREKGAQQTAESSGVRQAFPVAVRCVTVQPWQSRLIDQRREEEIGKGLDDRSSVDRLQVRGRSEGEDASGALLEEELGKLRGVKVQLPADGRVGRAGLSATLENAAGQESLGQPVF
jgi:hypothetical protein